MTQYFLNTKEAIMDGLCYETPSTKMDEKQVCGPPYKSYTKEYPYVSLKLQKYVLKYEESKVSPANEMVRRVIRSSPSDKLSKTFRNLGRIIKTDYILRYITDINLRRKVQRQLNKGEYRHILSRWIFFANQGKFQIGDYGEWKSKSVRLAYIKKVGKISYYSHTYQLTYSRVEI